MMQQATGNKINFKRVTSIAALASLTFSGYGAGAAEAPAPVKGATLPQAPDANPPAWAYKGATALNKEGISQDLLTKQIAFEKTRPVFPDTKSSIAGYFPVELPREASLIQNTGNDYQPVFGKPYYYAFSGDPKRVLEITYLPTRGFLMNPVPEDFRDGKTFPSLPGFVNVPGVGAITGLWMVVNGPDGKSYFADPQQADRYFAVQLKGDPSSENLPRSIPAFKRAFGSLEPTSCLTAIGFPSIRFEKSGEAWQGIYAFYTGVTASSRLRSMSAVVHELGRQPALEKVKLADTLDPTLKNSEAPRSCDWRHPEVQQFLKDKGLVFEPRAGDTHLDHVLDVLVEAAKSYKDVKDPGLLIGNDRTELFNRLKGQGHDVILALKYGGQCREAVIPAVAALRASGYKAFVLVGFNDGALGGIEHAVLAVSVDDQTLLVRAEAINPANNTREKMAAAVGSSAFSPFLVTYPEIERTVLPWAMGRAQDGNPIFVNNKHVDTFNFLTLKNDPGAAFIQGIGTLAHLSTNNSIEALEGNFAVAKSKQIAYFHAPSQFYGIAGGIQVTGNLVGASSFHGRSPLIP